MVLCTILPCLGRPCKGILVKAVSPGDVLYFWKLRHWADGLGFECFDHITFDVQAEHLTHYTKSGSTHAGCSPVSYKYTIMCISIGKVC